MIKLRRLGRIFLSVCVVIKMGVRVYVGNTLVFVAVNMQQVVAGKKIVIRENIIGRTVLDDPFAFIEHIDGVGYFSYHVKVVRGCYNGLSFSAGFDDQVYYMACCERVKTRRRLVKQDNVRIYRKNRRERCFAFLPDAKLVRGSVQKMCDLEKFGKRREALFYFIVRHTELQRPENYVFPHGGAEQRNVRILENKTNFAAKIFRELFIV